MIITNIFLACWCFVSLQAQKYAPTWDSLDTRPLPQWYDDAKVGIFIHWGVFAVPSFNGEWFWWTWEGANPSKDALDFMSKNYPPDFTYADFAHDFHAEFFNASEWASLFKAAGAKYVVLTSKHHEGYCLWPSTSSWNWNSMSVGPKRDIIDELASALRQQTTLKLGLYHSLFEWFNPIYLQDKQNNFTTQDFVRFKTMPELYDIVNRYKPEVIWSDGEWEAFDSYWNSTQFLAWLYNESPVRDSVVTNDRWGIGDLCHHGDFYTCADNYNPGTLQGHKWENCMPLDKASWGYRRTMKLGDVLSINELLTSLIETVSCGGNILINIGPRSDGTISPIFEERLRQMGEWLSVNGEAIYSTKAWKYQNDSTNSNVWYTSNSGIVYALLIKPSTNSTLILSSPQTTPTSIVELLGYPNQLQWLPNQTGGSGITIDVSNVDFSSLPTQWAYVFKLKNVF